MINGLNIQVSGKELSALILGRIEHHGARVTKLTQQIKMLADGDEVEAAIEKFANTSNSPIGNMGTSLKSHQKKVVYFTFLRDHLLVEEDYSLTTGDLNTLEITSY